MAISRAELGCRGFDKLRVNILLIEITGFQVGIKKIHNVFKNLSEGFLTIIMSHFKDQLNQTKLLMISLLLPHQNKINSHLRIFLWECGSHLKICRQTAHPHKHWVPDADTDTVLVPKLPRTVVILQSQKEASADARMSQGLENLALNHHGFLH